jgi:hypothetical protein
MLPLGAAVALSLVNVAFATRFEEVPLGRTKEMGFAP